MPSIFEHLGLLPSSLLVLSVSHALGQTLEARQTQTTTLPAPLNIAPDQNWDGIDGLWSSFTLRVGTPAQSVRTFVSFKSYQTWVVLPQGCSAASDEQACSNARGNLFNSSASSTWDPIGIYDLWVEANLDYTGNADFGYDAVGLGGVGEGGPTLKNTTVGAFAVESFYLGVLGINPKPTNFTSFNDGSPSYMSMLKENKSIPSVSASYTAGAQYMYSGGVLASLVLGGYDASRFIENDVQFTFGIDNERDILLAVQSISTESATNSSPSATELLPAPIYAYIDSTVPQIWLPTASCLIFESVFGLEYNNATNLYLVNETLHQTLQQQNPNITFQLGQQLSGGPTVQITLPYAAFDLTAQPPYQGLPNQSYYFPLRRAENDTQYTLGRTFLQEAYLTVDWEAQNFNVSQVNWSNNYQEHLVAIPPFTGDATSPGTAVETTSPSNGLGAGAIAGIVVGAIALLILAVLLFFFLRRQRQNKRGGPSEKLGEDDSNARGRNVTVFPKVELEGSYPFKGHTSGSDSNRLLSAHGSTAPSTPGHAVSTLGYFSGGGSSTYSPSTPTAGEGTYSSTNSGSQGTSNGNRSSLISPLSPSNTSEADSKHIGVYEMAGDMPTIKEKDGRSLSEKEALQHRERMYNGVDSAPNSAVAVDETARPRDAPRRVNADDVVHAGALEPGQQKSKRGTLQHRAFSFEGTRGEEGTGTGTGTDELYE